MVQVLFASLPNMDIKVEGTEWSGALLGKLTL